MRELRRARPLLGTIVDIRIDDKGHGNEAIDAAFTAVAQVHEMMSFQSLESDLSRLNRQATTGSVTVHPLLGKVLRAALHLAQVSKGVFDPTLGAQTVKRGLAPAPSRLLPDPNADWRDVLVGENDTIAFARPLWLDLSGIAKGFAVDQAVAAMRALGITSGVVNAGGDLRAFGVRVEAVSLRSARRRDRASGAVEICDAALAASGGRAARRGGWRAISPLVAPTGDRLAGLRRSVAVRAPDCITADGLTKVVLFAPDMARDLLAQAGAQAWIDEGRPQ